MTERLVLFVIMYDIGMTLSNFFDEPVCLWRLNLSAWVPSMLCQLCQLHFGRPRNLAGGELMMKQGEQASQCCSELCYI